MEHLSVDKVPESPRIAEVANLRARIHVLEREVSTLKLAVEDAKEETESERRRRRDEERKSDALRKEIAEYQTLVREGDSEVARLAALLSASQETVTSSQRELEITRRHSRETERSLHEQLRALGADAAGLQAQVDDGARRLAEARQEARLATSQKESLLLDIKEKEAAYQAQIDALRRQCDDAQKAADSLQVQLGSVTSKSAALEQELARARETATEATRVCKDQERLIEELRTDLASAERGRDEAGQRTRAEVGHARSDGGVVLERARERWEAERESLSKALSAARIATQEQEATAMGLTRQLSAADSRFTALQRQKESLDEQLIRETARWAEGVEERERLLQRVADAESRPYSEASVARAAQREAEREAAALRDRVAALEGELKLTEDQRKEELLAMSEKIQRQEVRNSASDAEAERIRLRLVGSEEETRQRAEGLERALDSARQGADIANKEKTGLLQRIADLEFAVQDAIMQRDGLIAEREGLQAQSAASISSSSADAKRLQEQLAAAVAERNSLTSRLDAAASQSVRRVREHTAEMARMQEQHADDRKAWEAERHRATREIGEWRSELERSSARMHVLEAQREEQERARDATENAARTAAHAHETALLEAQHREQSIQRRFDAAEMSIADLNARLRGEETRATEALIRAASLEKDWRAALTNLQALEAAMAKDAEQHAQQIAALRAAKEREEAAGWDRAKTLETELAWFKEELRREDRQLAAAEAHIPHYPRDTGDSYRWREVERDSAVRDADSARHSLRSAEAHERTLAAELAAAHRRTQDVMLKNTQLEEEAHQLRLSLASKDGELLARHAVNVRESQAALDACEAKIVALREENATLKARAAAAIVADAEATADRAAKAESADEKRAQLEKRVADLEREARMREDTHREERDLLVQQHSLDLERAEEAHARARDVLERQAASTLRERLAAARAEHESSSASLARRAETAERSLARFERRASQSPAGSPYRNVTPAGVAGSPRSSQSIDGAQVAQLDLMLMAAEKTKLEASLREAQNALREAQAANETTAGIKEERAAWAAERSQLEAALREALENAQPRVPGTPHSERSDWEEERSRMDYRLREAHGVITRLEGERSLLTEHRDTLELQLRDARMSSSGNLADTSAPLIDSTGWVEHSTSLKDQLQRCRDELAALKVSLQRSEDSRIFAEQNLARSDATVQTQEKFIKELTATIEEKNNSIEAQRSLQSHERERWAAREAKIECELVEAQTKLTRYEAGGILSEDPRRKSVTKASMVNGDIDRAVEMMGAANTPRQGESEDDMRQLASDAAAAVLVLEQERDTYVAKIYDLELKLQTAEQEKAEELAAMQTELQRKQVEIARLRADLVTAQAELAKLRGL